MGRRGLRWWAAAAAVVLACLLGVVTGPVIVGEFGAFRDAYGNDIAKAAYGMRDLQVDTCQRGFDGWLFWTWDTTESADQQRLFRLTEQNGAINGQLAPIVRPNACAR